MRKKVLGFTLIELMIVIAIIAIIAAIAIPGLLRARIASNEGAASASLKSLVAAQASFHKNMAVNQTLTPGIPPNSTGEYGVFNELTGGSALRFEQGGLTKSALKIPDFSAAYNITTGAFANKSGYNYQIFVPATGAALTDDGAATFGTGVTITVAGDEETIQQQECRWICYAWPASYRSSGVRAFVVNESGEVFVSLNTDDATQTGYWFSSTNMPLYNSAMYNDTAAALPTTLDWTNISAKDNVNAIDTNHTWQPAS